MSVINFSSNLTPTVNSPFDSSNTFIGLEIPTDISSITQGIYYIYEEPSTNNTVVIIQSINNFTNYSYDISSNVDFYVDFLAVGAGANGQNGSNNGVGGLGGYGGYYDLGSSSYLNTDSYININTNNNGACAVSLAEPATLALAYSYTNMTPCLIVFDNSYNFYCGPGANGGNYFITPMSGNSNIFGYPGGNPGQNGTYSSGGGSCIYSSGNYSAGGSSVSPVPGIGGGGGGGGYYISAPGEGGYGGPPYVVLYFYTATVSASYFEYEEGSLIIKILGENKNVLTEFTAIPGELDNSKIISGEYIETAVKETFKRLKKYTYTDNIFNELLYSLSAFFSAIYLEQEIVSNIINYNAQVISNEINIDMFNKNVTDMEKSLADQYPNLYFNLLNQIQNSINNNKHILNRFSVKKL
jgi:hypothetical protein